MHITLMTNATGKPPVHIFQHTPPVNTPETKLFILRFYLFLYLKDRQITHMYAPTSSHMPESKQPDS